MVDERQFEPGISVLYNFSGGQVSLSLSPISCFRPCTVLPLGPPAEIQIDIPASLQCMRVDNSKRHGHW
jgi:hypothetical protein